MTLKGYSIAGDVKLTFNITDTSGTQIAKTSLPNFTTTLAIRGYTNTTYVFSYNGGTATNCIIDADGTIHVTIPAETFKVAGTLLCDFNPTTADAQSLSGHYAPLLLNDTEITLYK